MHQVNSKEAVMITLNLTPTEEAQIATAAH